ncbi:TAP-like protein-domain-containing protein [Xylaria bambusicola]|uniref:TAP-like protein-domain-containing protein n=1 Tax=Xylaria bambusicola TaxID=326684 RepID=UPI0020081168|nr:TAP-like protein-domain-containing protein [Xylaria bambusicola]KAI0508519.1 TAP-like protein-domain-containing protein [Xylaria bambusicola]
MPFTTSFQVTALLLAATVANVHGQTPVRSRGYPTSGIKWQQCPDDLNDAATLDVECGTLAVPLDYTDVNSTETLELSLVKVPAVRKPAKNSILFNFGGPGLEDRYSLAGLGDMLQAVTGGEHDLITWDPRGTANTLTFSCFANATERAALSQQFGLGNASDVARGAVWAGAKNFADACANYPEAQKRGPLISTAFTARDAMQIVDAVEEDGLLRYWGLSYGTDLGVTLAALFPDRIDKVIIDGVYSPIQYYNDWSESESGASADDTFTEFFRQCLSTPNACQLARTHPNATAEQLESAAYGLLDELKYRPFAYDGSIVDYSVLKTAIRFSLYSPNSWLSLDRILDALLAEPRNETVVATELLAYLSGSLAATAGGNDAGIGIECTDKRPRSDSFDVVNPAFDQSAASSRLLGDINTAIVAICAQWRLETRERYNGDFTEVKTRKPLLVIGNTYDSATSIKSARNISETIEGSVLLEHGGVGHTSISHPSLCTAKVTQAFFSNGTLPKHNTICDTVAPPFQFATSGPSWQELFPELGFELPSTNSTKSTQKKRDINASVLGNIGRRGF